MVQTNMKCISSTDGIDESSVKKLFSEGEFVELTIFDSYHGNATIDKIVSNGLYATFDQNTTVTCYTSQAPLTENRTQFFAYELIYEIKEI